MTAHDRNPENIMDPRVRRLSEYLFSLYHQNLTPGEPEQGRHSRVSDRIAKSLAESPCAIMKLATLMAYCHGMPETQEVTAFAGARRDDAPEVELPEWLKEMCERKPTIHEGNPGVTGGGILTAILLNALLSGNDDPELHEQDLIDEDGDLNPMVLWARAHQMLGGDDADVHFDPGYIETCDNDRHPGIHGHGVDPFTVNGAMVSVLAEANMMERLQEAADYMADTQDEDGWVYCA